MQYVFAAGDCNVTDPATGLRVHLRQGDAWAADDPFVKARPDLFNAAPPVVRTSGGVVEQATAAPGEKRSVRRGG